MKDNNISLAHTLWTCKYHVVFAPKYRRKDLVYMAAYMDPHTAAELSMDDIKALCDDLFEAHKDWLPEYK